MSRGAAKRDELLLLKTAAEGPQASLRHPARAFASNPLLGARDKEEGGSRGTHHSV